METVKEVMNEIMKDLSQVAASKKDEVVVMQAMLNDTTYKVGVYGKGGKIGEYSPSDDARSMISSVICSTTKIGKEESNKLATEHIFSKPEASSLVNISKEFINTYVQTGRKLPLGAREESNVSLSKKEVKSAIKSYPKQVGVDSEGKGIYERPLVEVKGYKSLKVHGSCPKYL